MVSLVHREYGAKLAALNHGMATGRIDRGRALATVMADQNLMRAAFDAAGRGLINLAL